MCRTDCFRFVEWNHDYALKQTNEFGFGIAKKNKQTKTEPRNTRNGDNHNRNDNTFLFV